MKHEGKIGSFRPRKKYHGEVCEIWFIYMAEATEIGAAKSIAKFTIMLAMRRKMQKEVVRYT